MWLRGGRRGAGASAQAKPLQHCTVPYAACISWVLRQIRSLSMLTGPSAYQTHEAARTLTAGNLLGGHYGAPSMMRGAHTSAEPVRRMRRHDPPIGEVVPSSKWFLVNVGLPRTGTTSFQMACESIGLNTIHSWNPPGRTQPEHKRDHWYVRALLRDAAQCTTSKRTIGLPAPPSYTSRRRMRSIRASAQVPRALPQGTGGHAGPAFEL